MPDPIVNAQQILVPPAVNAGGPVANQPTGVESGAQAVADALSNGLKPDGWQPEAVPEEPADQEKPREVYASVQESITRTVGSIFAPRPIEAAAEPTSPVFDPATARKYGDGSLQPPAGRPTPGAPRPGQGKVNPPGLQSGNSVFRYGQDGKPGNFTILDQGTTNGCGTTSLAMMLNFMAGGKPLFDREKIDSRIRHYDMFTSPGEIAKFAERHGLKAAIHSGTSLDELRAMIDQGLPVQVLIDVDEAHAGTGLHYEVVTGYGVGPDGKSYLELANPWGQREYIAEDAFLKRWSDLSAKGFPLGIDRVAIALKPRNSRAQLLSDHRGAWFNTGMTALHAARGLTEVTSGFARRDPATWAGGLVRLVGTGIFGIPALLGHAGARLGQRLLASGSLGKQVLGAATLALALPIEAVGNIGARLADGAANALNAGMRGVGRLFG